MSASSKKKLRKEQTAAMMTEKQKAAQKEAKKLKIYTWSFWIVMILIVAIVAGVALQAPVNVAIDRLSTSIVVGSHKVSGAELNYFYIDAINQYCNENSSWISYLIDTSKPLSEQVVDATSGETWADSFIDMAVSNAKNTYALYDAAKAAGHKLTDEEKTAMDELYKSMDSYAEQLGYSNASKYLQSVYGRSASKGSYKDYYEVTTLASSYYNAHMEELKDSYKPADLRAFEKDKSYEYNSYDYASFYMNLDDYKTGGTKGEDGKMTYTEEELKAAEEALKAAAEKLANADNNTVEKLNAAIAELEKSQEEAEKDDKDDKDEAKPETKPDDKTEGTTEDKTEDKEEATGETTDSSSTEADTENTAVEEPTVDPDAPVTSDDATEPSKDTAEDAEDVKDEADDKEKEESKEEDKTEDKDDKDDKEETKYSTCTENEDVLYSSISSVMNEWLRDEDRKEGDITALRYETTSTDKDGKETKTLKGYYVVLYLGVNDNTYPLTNVRHILVAFKGGTKDSTTGETKYSQAEKDTAKKKAQEILDQWKAGDATEDSFAKLANEKSDDGDGTTGGLYEDIYPGQMVSAFEDWCFDETRKPGDTGMVETEYGWHVMYYVSDSEQNYRDYMVTNDLLEKEMEEWQTALNDAMSLTEKNTDRVDKDLVLSKNGLA